MLGQVNIIFNMNTCVPPMRYSETKRLRTLDSLYDLYVIGNVGI